MPIIGIFSTWDLSFLDKPENVLKRRLDQNPYYPFEELKPNVYHMRVKSANFTLGVFFLIVTLIVTGSVYGAAGAVNEFIVYPVLVFLGSLGMTISDIQGRTYILDYNRKMYEFYRGKRLVYRGHFHNIYIRIKGQKTGAGDTYYTLILDGFEVDEKEITRGTTRHDRLAKLGRRIAYRMDLNFFDFEDKSRYHIIRHRCPYDTDPQV